MGKKIEEEGGWMNAEEVRRTKRRERREAKGVEG